MKGKVKWFSARKGYGFILGADEKEYFVHYSDIVGKGYKVLETDQKVTFDVEKIDNDRVKAARVAIV